MTKTEFAKSLIRVCGLLDSNCFLFGGAVRDLVAADFDENNWNFNDLDIYLDTPDSKSLFKFTEAIHGIMTYLHRNDLVKGFIRNHPYGDVERFQLQMTDYRCIDIFNVDFVCVLQGEKTPFREDVDVNCLAINCFTFDSPFYFGKNKLDPRFSQLNIDEIIKNIKNREFVANGARAGRIEKIKSKGYVEKSNKTQNVQPLVQPIEKVCICGRKNYTDVETCWYCGRKVNDFSL